MERNMVYNILIKILFTSHINKKERANIYTNERRGTYLHGFLFRMYVKTWFNCVIK